MDVYLRELIAMLLTASQILEAPDLKFEDVPCPEWGGDVRIRNLTGIERDAYEASLIVVSARESRVDRANVRARLVSLAACDESGKAIFTPADVERLGGKSAAALDRCYDVAARLAGLSAADQKDLEKN